MTKLNRHETEAKINAHAWKSPEFKEKLLKDPKAALKEFGMENIPETLKVKVIEEHEGEWTIVLRQPPKDSAKMSEEELLKSAAANLRQLCFSSGCTG